MNQTRKNELLEKYHAGRLTEAENLEQDFFEVEGAATVLNRFAKKDMTGLVKALQDAVTDFSAGAPQSDDITMLALRYQGID